MSVDRTLYLKILAEKYQSVQAVCREIINLNAILNLPKGTEHFMSDLHGEYEAFCHILNNCSGVIREKVDLLFEEQLNDSERQAICTLIYYPKEKLEQLKKENALSMERYRMILNQLIEIAKLLSSKYTRSKVRKAMPEDFAYIIDELLHVQKDEDDNQVRYHQKILDTILEIDNADEFIVALAELIKRLAVDHLHIVGDIFDRGPYADKIMDLLMNYHSLDFEWGNHDILWMGAAAGNQACIANVLKNNLRHHNTEILESGYGISLRELALFAEKTYANVEPMEAADKAVSVMLLKLEGQTILRHPEYEMKDRLLLSKIDKEKKTVAIDGKEYPLKDGDFPTLQREDVYALTEEEAHVMDELTTAFINSDRLQRHISYLYEKGSMYRIFNGNLLYHGCVPLDESGNFDGVRFGDEIYQGKCYLDYSEHSHIINGHTPVKTMEGEQPIRAGGKLLVIDGGFCKDYHKTTGIAGYTLIYNSHGMRIKAHHPFESVKKALQENKDIASESQIVETEKTRVLVKDTDVGKKIMAYISDLEE